MIERNEVKARGLIIEPIVREGKKRNYVFSGFTKIAGEVINPTGNWLSYLPVFEKQLIGAEDTWSCTVYGTLSALEMIGKRLFGIETNWSDRFLAIAAKIRPGIGGSPHQTAEALRKIGDVIEVELPASEAKTVAEFYTPSPLPTSLLAKAEQQFLDVYDFEHEYVFEPDYALSVKQVRLMEALQRSPCGISVAAWGGTRNGLYYKPEGVSDNHWVALVGYEKDKKWIIFDSDDPEQKLKELEWNYPFETAKVYYLRKLTPEEVEARRRAKLSIVSRILDIIGKILGIQALLIKRQDGADQPPLLPERPLPEQPKYLWDTPEHTRKSVRIICDEEGLSVATKNLICAVIQCESNFNTKAVHKNDNGTVDYGIIQANTKWYIGEGKPIASIDEALNNPERCVRVIIQQSKKGRLNDWVCYRSNKYKQYL